MARTRRSSTKITVSLKNYDPEGANYGSGEGGGFHIPDGAYQMKCTSVEEKMSKNDNPMLEWKFVGVGGRAKGKSFYYYTVMDDEQKLGKTLDALGLETVQDDFTFDIDEVVDARVMGDVATDTYNGERRSKLKLIRPMDSDEEETGDEEDETPKKDNGKKKAVKLSQSEVTAMNEDELEELSEKHELEVNLAKHKTLGRKKTAVIEALTEKGLLA